MHFKEVKGILSARNGMNIYRGCTHGCIYCDSRSKCYQMDHDFEDIEVKVNAPQLLEQALIRKRKKCVIGTGSMCDPYLHLEREIMYTRKCLEIIDRHGFGVTLLTKSDMLLRDLDLLKRINEKSTCIVQMTLTTYDEDLCRVIEPNVSTTRERFEALKILRDNGIETAVWLCPILPFINDTEENLRGILDYCFEAEVRGILCFGMGLTLREGDREYFYENLDRNFPGMKQKYREKYGLSYSIHSDNSRALTRLARAECRKHGVESDTGRVFEWLGTYVDKQIGEQMSLF
ncbi:MAG: radical SAM protein [Oscillospiraceae bacterium]|nr:radical SAM protein [Oscillospiraceae bacterium]